MLEQTIVIIELVRAKSFICRSDIGVKMTTKPEIAGKISKKSIREDMNYSKILNPIFRLQFLDHKKNSEYFFFLDLTKSMGLPRQSFH